ncbi:MAG: hypothetical protein DME46_09590 [Verrucomicrobia bacterium]|nr:MAG: hypothetical protein DME46_09590 [Verrucomicrobiota bacterium]
MKLTLGFTLMSSTGPSRTAEQDKASRTVDRVQKPAPLEAKPASINQESSQKRLIRARSSATPP